MDFSLRISRNFYRIRRAVVRTIIGSCLCGVFILPFKASVALSPDERTSSTTSTKHPLPPIPIVKNPVDSPKVLRQVYEFAAEHPEVLNYVRCYCVCGQVRHHRSSENCFVKNRSKDGSLEWDDHAATCDICVAVVKEARALYLKGMSVRAIRDKIDQDFSPKFKNHTDTPEPPAEGAALHLR